MFDRPSFSRVARRFGGLVTLLMAALFVPSSSNAADTRLAYIGGPPSSWDTNAIANALAPLHPDPIPDVGAFIHVMADLAEPGLVPRNLNQMSSKPVPMINELIVSNTLKLVLDNGQEYLEHRVYFTIECWFPFTAISQITTFRVVLGAFAVSFSSPPYPAFTAPPESISGPAPGVFVPEPGGFNLTSFVALQRQPINGSGQPLYSPGGRFSVRVDILGNTELIAGETDIVDRVNGPWPSTTFTLSGLHPSLLVGGPEVRIDQRSAGVIDPRINWNPPSHWFVSAPTPGTTNAVVATNTTIRPIHGGGASFASVLELTNLLFSAGQHWTTIRLDTNDATGSYRIIDRLSVIATNMGTPCSWLIAEGYTDGVDTAEWSTGANGIPVWQSYVAGLSPSNPDSHFLTSMESAGAITFGSITDRFYNVWSSDDLYGTDWSNPIATNVPGNGELITVTDPNPPGNRSYRIDVGR